MTHNELIRKLEQEYTNYICKLLKQKSMILNDLQQQFTERRNRIKQTLSNRHIIDNEENQILHPLETDHALNQLYMPSASNDNESQISGIESLNNAQQKESNFPKRRSKRLKNKKSAKNDRKSEKLLKNKKKKKKMATN